MFGPMSAQLVQIRDIEVYMESGRQVFNFPAHMLTQAHKLVCMHTLFLRASAYISAQMFQIRENEVSTESRGYADPFSNIF